jgi:hypothetical protein
MGGRTPAVAGLLAVAALSLTGCGLQLRLPTRPAHAVTSTATSTATPASNNEVPTPPRNSEHAPGLASPAKAVRSFVTTFINWNAADVAKQLGSLARRSVGQARTEMRLEAAETRADKELHRGGIANAGHVESVARLRRGGRNRYVVVTLERTTASRSAQYDDLAAAWHVALATVRSVDHGRRWVVSGWQPES